MQHCRMIRLADPAAVAAAAAGRLLAAMSANPGRIAVCLSGGGTPRPLYDLLATDTYAAAIPWDRVHWFMGDERVVPATDPRNNFREVCEAFLKSRAPADHLHPVPTGSGSAETAARLYAEELQQFYGGTRLDERRPLFDLVFLGVGADGHTASLFPGGSAIDVEDRWAVAVAPPRVPPHVPRVSLTRPVLASCRTMVFLVTGEGKRDIMRRLSIDHTLPAARVASQCETLWLHDMAS
ncbi:MAG: 6-phosphogluconolactonase [Pseudorhodoplanes sp.]